MSRLRDGVWSGDNAAEIHYLVSTHSFEEAAVSRARAFGVVDMSVFII